MYVDIVEEIKKQSIEVYNMCPPPVANKRDFEV